MFNRILKWSARRVCSPVRQDFVEQNPAVDFSKNTHHTFCKRRVCFFLEHPRNRWCWYSIHVAGKLKDTGKTRCLEGYPIWALWVSVLHLENACNRQRFSWLPRHQCLPVGSRLQKGECPTKQSSTRHPSQNHRVCTCWSWVATAQPERYWIRFCSLAFCINQEPYQHQEFKILGRNNRWEWGVKTVERSLQEVFFFLTLCTVSTMHATNTRCKKNIDPKKHENIQTTWQDQLLRDICKAWRHVRGWFQLCRPKPGRDAINTFMCLSGIFSASSSVGKKACCFNFSQTTQNKGRHIRDDVAVYIHDRRAVVQTRQDSVCVIQKSTLDRSRD